MNIKRQECRLLTLCLMGSIAFFSGCGPSAKEAAENERRDAMREASAATAALDRGDFESAHQHLDVSMGIQSTAEAFRVREMVFRKQGKLADAIKTANAGLGIYPGDVDLTSARDLGQKLLDSQIAQTQLETAMTQIDTGCLLVTQELQAAHAPEGWGTEEGNRIAKERVQQIDQRYAARLRKAVDHSQYWMAKRASEREEYLAKALQRDELAIIKEAVVRESFCGKDKLSPDAGEKAVEAMLAKHESAAAEHRRQNENKHQLELVNDLRFIMETQDDFWQRRSSDERESYIASIVRQGAMRLEAEVAGRKKYWNDRYLSSEDPLSPEEEEEKERGYVSRSLSD